MAPKNTNKATKGTKKVNDEAHNEDAQILAQVIRAVKNMKQDQGCTTRMIIEHLQSVRTSPRRGNTKDRLVAEVRRALRIAVSTGLLEAHAGKYVLASKGSKGESNKRKAGKGKNQQGGKRRRSPSNSPSRSPTGDEVSDSSERSRSISSNEDDSNAERSEKGTRKHKRKEETRNKRKNKNKHRSRSHDSDRSRSRSEQKKNESEPPDNASNENQNKQGQQQTDKETLPRPYNVQRHKRAKTNNKGWRNQQTDETEGSNPQNEGDLNETSGCGNRECLCNLQYEQRQSSSDPEREAEPEPECTKEPVNDYVN